MRSPQRFLGLAIVIAVMTVCAHAADKITWKPVPGAVLRIDDKAPKEWSLFTAGRKNDPLLIQLGTRSLVFYVQQQKVYEIAPAQLEHKGDNLLWREEKKPGQPLPTSDWTIRDVGSAMRLRMKLSAEGRSFDIEIPEIPDLR